MPNSSIPKIVPTVEHKITLAILSPAFQIRHLRCLPHSGVFAILTVRASHSWRATGSSLRCFMTRTYEQFGFASLEMGFLFQIVLPHERTKTLHEFLIDIQRRPLFGG